MAREWFARRVNFRPRCSRHLGGPHSQAMTGHLGLRVRVMNTLLVFALVLSAAGCGTKTELLMPNGKPTPRDQHDPSQPPSPLSR